MAEPLIFIYGTEAQILALESTDANWIDRAFYYPEDRDYFYQVSNGVMKKYVGGESSSTGVKLNDKVIGGVPTFIAETDVLEAPENFDMNTYKLNIDGIVNISGQINIQ